MVSEHGTWERVAAVSTRRARRVGKGRGQGDANECGGIGGREREREGGEREKATNVQSGNDCTYSERMVHVNNPTNSPKKEPPPRLQGLLDS